MPRERVTVLVEFLGLPGSGKSTVATDLRDRLRERGHSPIALIGGRRMDEHRLGYHGRRGRSVLTLMREDSGFCATSVREIVGTGQRSVREYISVLWNWLSKRGDLFVSTRAPNETVIIDEGIFHAAWSVNYSATSRALSQKVIMRAAHLPGVVKWILIDLAVPVHAIVPRLEARSGRQHRIIKDIERGEAALERAEEALNSVRNIAGECLTQGLVHQYHRIENDDKRSVKRTAKRIESIVMRDMNGGSTRGL